MVGGRVPEGTVRLGCNAMRTGKLNGESAAVVALLIVAMALTALTTWEAFQSAKRSSRRGETGHSRRRVDRRRRPHSSDDLRVRRALFAAFTARGTHLSRKPPHRQPGGPSPGVLRPAAIGPGSHRAHVRARPPQRTRDAGSSRTSAYVGGDPIAGNCQASDRVRGVAHTAVYAQ